MKAIPAILVVDDDRDHCSNLADILEEFDYEVDIAHDGFEALRLLERRTYDAALLDLVMPGMDGMTLLRRMREQHPELAVCFVTVGLLERRADEVPASQTGPILAKPIDVPRLLYWIDGAVGRRRWTRAPGPRALPPLVEDP